MGSDYQHWRCECGAYGNSNAPEVNKAVIELHLDKGHSVTVWERGRTAQATVVGGE